MITLKHISKTYRRQPAKEPFKVLDDVNLHVDKGSIVGIIGSSGAGKSTLLRCINLLEIPDHGQVIVNGRALTDLSKAQLAKERQKIGMIFQQFNLLSSRSVFENIAFPLRLSKLPRLQIERKVTELLQLVGLSDKTFEYPANLSGGQKQRVAIARALANDPHLLLCDEATSALDPASASNILALLQDISSKLNITILLVTHQMEVVKSICDVVVEIDGGRLISKQSMEEFLSSNSGKQTDSYTLLKRLNQPEFSDSSNKDSLTELNPVIGIVLDGSVLVERLMDAVSVHTRAQYKIVSANIEYLNAKNFGNVVFQLKADGQSNSQLFHYFEKNKIKYTVNNHV